MQTDAHSTDGGSLAALARRAKTAKQWLFEAAFPIWWERGFDRAAACFHERLALDGAPLREAPRRIRVQARQTYAYAAAGALGWNGPWRDAVTAGAAVLLERGLNADGGVIHKLGADGRPADTRRDLYDLAFAVFALAHAGRALNDPSCFDAAESLIDWAFEVWSHPQGGLREGEIATTPPRRQNPHMHVLEALLALHDARGSARSLDRARNLVALADARFVDRQSGALLEYFEEDWRPFASDEGRIVEPGHQFEWAWLIDRYRRLGGADAPLGAARRLHAFAERHGQNNEGFTVAEVWIDGSVRTPSARLWPHAERLKSNLIRFEEECAPEAAAAAVQAFDALMAYCEVSTAGLWRDRRLPSGDFVQEAAPASSFYHIVLAFSELIRVAGRLNA